MAASQNDLQDLLRLLTASKVSIKDAMIRVKKLQGNNLRSIKQIAEATLADVEAALADDKVARSLHNACKARMKQMALDPSPHANSKRPVSGHAGGPAKRPRTDDNSEGAGLVEDPEAPFLFPVETNESIIAATVLTTNRAPLVLAFATELLRFTMPWQPPSSRLSLAQAAVSANSRSKAASIGLQPGPTADEMGLGHGQPRVRVMGRDVSVLKRGGYFWQGGTSDADVGFLDPAGTGRDRPSSIGDPATQDLDLSWTASRTVTSKESKFVVRVVSLPEAGKRQSLLQALFEATPSLRSATHNAWAYRVNTPTHLFGATTVKENSCDDGEAGCGNFLLKCMRESNTINTLVVMSRWYGGMMLGPDRWRIMQDCFREATAERLRVTGEQASPSHEAVWGLDLETMKKKSEGPASRPGESSVVGMPIHTPENAKAYLLKSFNTRAQKPGDSGKPISNAQDSDAASLSTSPASPVSNAKPKRKSAKALELEAEENVSRLLGALRLLYQSWAGHLDPSELDRRAWSWYVSVRPDVENGPAGWGAKGEVDLSRILALRRVVDG